jgi:hypothetical protein
MEIETAPAIGKGSKYQGIPITNDPARAPTTVTTVMVALFKKALKDGISL